MDYKRLGIGVNKNYLKGYQATFKDGIESVRFYNDK